MDGGELNPFPLPESPIAGAAHGARFPSKLRLENQKALFMRSASSLTLLSAMLGAALVLGAGGSAPAQMPGAAQGEKPDGSADATVNLKAYAEYKMGHYDEAKRIWEGLAAKGNTTAMINLSNMFGQGNGVTADQKKAFGYTQKAAELGDARAQHDVGLAYEKGTMVPRDIGKAAEWLKKSADQDYGDGQFAYGVLLATGRGKGLDKATDADKAEALDYLKKAKANGNDEAGDYIKTLGGAKG